MKSALLRACLSQVLLLTFVAVAAAADAAYPVRGEWFLSAGNSAYVLGVGDKVVTLMDQPWCTDPVVDRVDPVFAVVDCLADGAAMQLYFLFDSAEHATLWIPRSPSLLGPVERVLARRRSNTPLPETLIGRWAAVSPPTRGEPAPFLEAVDFQQNLVKAKTSSGLLMCECVPLWSSDEGAKELYLGCEQGVSTVLRLRTVSPGGFILTNGFRGELIALHREGLRPPWFAVDTGSSLTGICDEITDSLQRENCFVSRALCDTLPDAREQTRCRQEADRRGAVAAIREVKRNLAAIGSTEIAYFAEWEVYVGNQPPTPIADRRGNNTPVAWVGKTRFEVLGFVPQEDEVRCSYALGGSDLPTSQDGFAARAECDLDRDGELSVWTITDQSREPVHSGDDF
ncbi:MAG TPA: hypothetical protein VN317_03980 [Candidatus Methanoperedens sp.]|nr:hypothetical protein [Candidatus Methanoperedens sp.]